MSITSGPMLPWYTGISTLGLPLLNDRVALLSANFIFRLSEGFSQHFQNFTHIVAVELGVHLAQRFPCQLNIQQVVVTQIHQITQCLRLPDIEGGAEPLKEPLDKQVVLQQSPAASPPQFA
jgi:hypothetical protein